jgi:peptidoglycan/LPS O-acetylase OafA/YrhL
MCIFILGTILAAIQCEIESGRINREFIKPIVPLSYLSLLALVFMTPAGASLILDDVKGNLFHKDFIQYTVFWSIILLSVVNFNSKLSSLFKMKWLRFYGALSFSIYLFHPVFIGMARKMMLGEYISAWFVIFSSTLTSYISYRFLELPVSKIKFKDNE